MKRIVVCLDGTWKSAQDGKKATNVVKLMRSVANRDDNGVEQVLYYDKGVGAEGGKIERAIAGATGRGLAQNVKDAYQFLGNNHEDRDGAPDEIYLFGFSRGAFTARSLAGLIETCGLLHREELRHFDDAWAHYRTPKAKRRPLKHPGHPVRINCVGVWDTVGALGIPITGLSLFRRRKQKRYAFHDTDLGSQVDHAFHAVAIDEKRGPFAPTLWQLPTGQDPKAQTVEQVWFMGAHSDVGGGYASAGLSNLALEWMIGRVKDTTDLAFRGDWRDQYTTDPQDPKPIKGDPMGDLHESRSATYAFSRIFPYHRIIGEADSWTKRKKFRVNRPRPGHRFVAERLHGSVDARWKREGPPKGRPYEPVNVAAAMKANVPVVPWPAQEHAATAPSARTEPPATDGARTEPIAPN